MQQHTFVFHTQTYVNNTATSNNGSNYAYKAYIKDLVYSSQLQKHSQLESQGYYADNGKNFENTEISNKG